MVSIAAPNSATSDQLVQGLSEGDRARVLAALDYAGEVYAEYENPRGHLGFYIESQGGVVPYRVKIRGPSFVNLQALDVMCRGQLVADVIAVIGTLDIVLGEVDG